MQRSSSTTSGSQRKRGWTSDYYEALIRRLQSTGNGWSDAVPQVIGVTSCRERQGVTTVASNLSIAAASVAGGPVLLVDANVHRPAVGRIFRVNSNMGLLNALAGEKTVFDCLIESPIENLSLLLGGELPKHQRPYYDPATIEELLDSLKHVFCLTVFDLPPAHSLTNCFSFANRLDGILVNIEAESVRRDVALQTRGQLEKINANVLGVVYNKTRS